MIFPVDPHTHTIACTHAYSTLGEYITEARRKGIRLFACTDHSPRMPDGPHPWHFLNLRVIPRVMDGVGILRGIESNIRDMDGTLDLPGDVTDGLDLVLAAFHEPVFEPRTSEEHTLALVNTIKRGQADIIAHPGNPSFPIDIETVVQAAIDYDVALEINNSSFSVSRRGSKPYCRAIIEVARDMGATLVLGSDSHFAPSLGVFGEAVELIEEAGFPKERLLNTSPQVFLEFLERRGHPHIPEMEHL